LTTATLLIKVGFEILSSFTHLGHVCGRRNMLVVHASQPSKSVGEVVAMAKSDPYESSYRPSGGGGPSAGPDRHETSAFFKFWRIQARSATRFKD